MSESYPGPWQLHQRPEHVDAVTPVSHWHINQADTYLQNMGIADVWGRGNHKEDEAAARLMVAAPELAAVLIEYEKLEAEMILDDKCWTRKRLPDYYFDRLIELQHKRNAALKKAGLRPHLEAKAAKAEGGES